MLFFYGETVDSQLKLKCFKFSAPPYFERLVDFSVRDCSGCTDCIAILGKTRNTQHVVVAITL